VNDPSLISDPPPSKLPKMKDSKSSSRYGDYYKISSLEEVWTLYKEVWNPEEEKEEEKEVVMK